MAQESVPARSRDKAAYFPLATRRCAAGNARTRAQETPVTRTSPRAGGKRLARRAVRPSGSTRGRGGCAAGGMRTGG